MWILLFSEVTLFEYNVSTILSPIVALAIARKIQKELRKKDNTFSPKPIFTDYCVLFLKWGTIAGTLFSPLA